MGFIFIVLLGVAIVVIVKVVNDGNQFRDNANRIVEGMKKEDVLRIMGQPNYVKSHQDGSYEFVYERSEWKSAVRGGTKVRRIEIVFSTENVVISVGRNGNINMPGW